LIVKPIEPLGPESLSSPRDAIGRAVQPSRDIDVLHPVGRVENHPRPLHRPERQRDRARPPFELSPFLLAEFDHQSAGSRHDT
jgi:hypothetical protein